eukprot:scaffold107285_cov16-Prasinocladus_malaysianus.AAC.1
MISSTYGYQNSYAEYPHTVRREQCSQREVQGAGQRPTLCWPQQLGVSDYRSALVATVPYGSATRTRSDTRDQERHTTRTSTLSYEYEYTLFICQDIRL